MTENASTDWQTDHTFDSDDTAGGGRAESVFTDDDTGVAEEVDGSEFQTDWTLDGVEQPNTGDEDDLDWEFGDLDVDCDGFDDDAEDDWQDDDDEWGDNTWDDWEETELEPDPDPDPEPTLDDLYNNLL